MGESSDSVDFGDSGNFDGDSGDFDVSGEYVNFDESSDSENFVDSGDFMIWMFLVNLGFLVNLLNILNLLKQYSPISEKSFTYQ